jgi:vacuolar-type H+-ATPase subunit H
MKRADRSKSTESEQAIKQVLQAERDAENAIRDCEDEAHQIIQDAQIRAQKIQSRTDQRITNMEMRHDHKLDQLIKSIERDGATELRLDVSQDQDVKELQAVIVKMAVELCQNDSSTPKSDGDS